MNIQTLSIIKNLNGKSKFSISKNSRKLGLSRQTYQNKLDILREEDVIKNFTININPDIHPNNLKYVMLEIKTNPKEPELVDELLKISQLRMLDGIIGDFSLFALLIFKSSKEYYQILNTIDNIMAKSYFKKYQIIETIKVFKTNGISLRKTRLSLKERLIDELRTADLSENKLLIEIKKKMDLNEIFKRNEENSNIKFNPEKFPGLLIQYENSALSIIIFPDGKIVISGLKSDVKIEQVIEMIFKITGLQSEQKIPESEFEIDDTDFTILNILRDFQGSRPISTYDISGILKDQFQTEVSQSTIHNRIKRLEHNGVILNYAVNFSPKKIGFEGKYLLRIKPKDPSKYDELAMRLDSNKYITDLFRIGEQYGLFAIVRVKSIEDYAIFIKDLYSSEEIEDTYTNFVLDELKPYTNFFIF
ncbi:MAG: Lrp/AsnC ligand binding domain-containing protein [Candidatus Thorarchaeota archaeon]